MRFKKTSSTIDDFVEKATGETKNEPKKDIPKVQIKMNKEMFNFFDIKTKESILTKSQFLISLYFNPNEYFTDTQMLNIFNKAISNNMGIRDYIRYKLNLIKREDIKSKAHKTEQKHLVGAYVSKKKREEANIIASNANLSMQNYGYLKILFAMETENLFSFDEIVAIKKDAEEKQLGLEDYIALRIQYD